MYSKNVETDMESDWCKKHCYKGDESTVQPPCLCRVLYHQFGIFRIVAFGLLVRL